MPVNCEAAVKPEDNKSIYVRNMFSGIAGRYDLLNSLMSLGIHRRWKWRTIRTTRIKAGDRVLDLCAGTSDLAILAKDTVTRTGFVTALDFCLPMLEIGREKANERQVEIGFVNGDALLLPYRDESFDACTVGFGIRNVADIQAAFVEVCRVLKPGGRFVCLEFSHPANPVVSSLYDLYSDFVIPRLGRWLTKSEDAYKYLPASIRDFPDQERLKSLLVESGFATVSYENHQGGIVAIHVAQKSSAITP